MPEKVYTSVLVSDHDEALEFDASVPGLETRVVSHARRTAVSDRRRRRRRSLSQPHRGSCAKLSVRSRTLTASITMQIRSGVRCGNGAPAYLIRARPCRDTPGRDGRLQAGPRPRRRGTDRPDRGTRDRPRDRDVMDVPTRAEQGALSGWECAAPQLVRTHRYSTGHKPHCESSAGRYLTGRR